MCCAQSSGGDSPEQKSDDKRKEMTSSAILPTPDNSKKCKRRARRKSHRVCSTTGVVCLFQYRQNGERGVNNYTTALSPGMCIPSHRTILKL
jgi:hypothetical protein